MKSMALSRPTVHIREDNQHEEMNHTPKNTCDAEGHPMCLCSVTALYTAGRIYPQGFRYPSQCNAPDQEYSNPTDRPFRALEVIEAAATARSTAHPAIPLGLLAPIESLLLFLKLVSFLQLESFLGSVPLIKLGSDLNGIMILFCLCPGP